MKKPYECTNLEECQDICFYWMAVSLKLDSEKEVLSQILLENNIMISHDELESRSTKKRIFAGLA